MSYVKHILLPDEHILYEGHVHPKVLFPGMVLLGITAWILYLCEHSPGGHSYLTIFAYWLARNFPSTEGFYRTIDHWQQLSPLISPEVKIIALGVALWGFSKLMRGLVSMQTTELVVTEHRIVAKVGLMTVITLEMDRRRVAGIMIDQSFIGRIMGYGHIFIQGYTSSIGGLPPMVNPRLIEQFISIS